GNFPLTLERPNYYPNDRNGDQWSFEDRDEDTNHNGSLDLGEDIDMDGVLDKPNTLYPDAPRFQTVEFYERETNTLLMKPVMPLRQNTTYAVVLTRRLVDEDGRPVRSPFPNINHTAQTKQLEPLLPCLGGLGLALEDVSFTWPYSTQSVDRDFKAVRDGLYGKGPMSRLMEEYPAQVKELLAMRDTTPGSTFNAYIVPGDYFRGVAQELLAGLSPGGMISPEFKETADSQAFVDYHVVFTFDSPQFFPRYDSEGKWLPLTKQVWQVDAVTGAAFTRPEKITAWLTVPKKRSGPAPVAIMGHGYTGNKLDALFYGGFLARYGIATVGMENVSHGFANGTFELDVAKGLLGSKGLGAMFRAVVENHRAIDQNGDGIQDSGADFWTAYILHTRDVVRQSAVDYMQFVRVLRSFDGKNTWKYDANRDGQPDLAGDFDGDGVVDVGGSAAVDITGGSLGGIMSAMMAGLEPGISVSLPISGGAGLPDIGVRSIQGGVREAVNLRLIGPLLLTEKNEDTGKLELWQYLPDLNDTGSEKVADVSTVPLKEGDTVIVKNLTSGELRCGRVGAEGLFRVAVSSDQGDRYTLSAYSGPLPPKERDGCFVPDGTEPYWTQETFDFDFKFQGIQHTAGEPLAALGDGFGFRRQSPEMRRFMGLAQLAIERGDPINYLPNVERHRVLRYATGEEVSSRMLVFNTIGDMNVPVATGAAIARAAGYIDIKNIDPRYGKTPNRVLIDNGVLEATERSQPYRNSAGEPVLVDIEHLSSLANLDDGFDVPRLNPPFRMVRKSERVGGYTGVLFPMVVATGRHGIETPNPALPFDLGSFMLNLIGQYMATDGMEAPFEGCMFSNTCEWVPPAPAE
ncbi:MAG: hypothetical protein JNG84_07170, partial [Archangium sp.]|nr:hypothetical protein [Archangium sp.]